MFQKHFLNFVNGDFFLWWEGCVEGASPVCPSQRQSQRCFRLIRVVIEETVVFSLTCAS